MGPWDAEKTLKNHEKLGLFQKPICSMYGIFTIIYLLWVIFRVNVGKYSIHGAYGKVKDIFRTSDGHRYEPI